MSAMAWRTARAPAPTCGVRTAPGSRRSGWPQRQRLQGIGHVEGATQAAAPHLAGERREVQEPAAGDVHDGGAVGQARQLRAADHAPRLVGEAGREHEELRLGQEAPRATRSDAGRAPRGRGTWGSWTSTRAPKGSSSPARHRGRCGRSRRGPRCARAASPGHSRGGAPPRRCAFEGRRSACAVLVDPPRGHQEEGQGQLGHVGRHRTRGVGDGQAREEGPREACLHLPAAVRDEAQPRGQGRKSLVEASGCPRS